MVSQRKPQKNRGVVLSEVSLLLIGTNALAYILYMSAIRHCEAFPKPNRIDQSKTYVQPSLPSPTMIQHDSDDRRKRFKIFDADVKYPITLPSRTNEFKRRSFLMSATAALSLLPIQNADARQDEKLGKTLDDLQFARGKWNPSHQVRSAKGSSMNDDDQKFLASMRNDNSALLKSNKAVETIDACFITYLTRFLINYDEGVAAWWQQRQVAYSRLPSDQKQNRLGRDFGSLGASIQEALQFYLRSFSETRQGYEQLFDRFSNTYAVRTNVDEVGRQLCLLAAILPVNQQPKNAIQKIASTKTIAISLKDPNDSSFAKDISENLSILLPSQYTAVFTRSDKFLLIQPPISLYQVGVGEEFGQAATATTFGPLASSTLRRELPRYTFDIYVLFGISGAAGCALTHSVVIPLDVVKTRAQTSSGSTTSIVMDIVEEEGFLGLMTGAQATLAGYAWYGVSVYPCYALCKRFLGRTILTEDLAVAHVNDIALIAGALAAVVASLGLTPLEAARIRVVTEPTKYKTMGLIGTLRAIASEGGSDLLSSLQTLYKGLPSLMTRQVIFGSVKFLAFERACEAIYLAWPMLRDETWTALSVSLVAGAFSGTLSCFVSQPADAVLTYVAQESTNDTGNIKGLGVLEGSRLMIKELGVSSLFRGLGSRSLWAASIISGQFLLYDIFRNYFGVNSDDLSQIFNIDL